jgi:hypothetical protein
MPDTVNFLFFLFIQFVVGSMILALRLVISGRINFFR